MWNRSTRAADRDQYTLVLGGGAQLGAIQAGQLEALAQAGISVRRIIGCSVGALNGAWISRGLTSAAAGELSDMWRVAGNDKLFDRGLRRAVRVVAQRNALSGNSRVYELARAACPTERLEAFPTPLEIVTCNLTNGTVEYHTSGDAVERVVASCSMPGVFPPVVIDGDLHVDGGVLDVLPWRRAGQERALVLDCRAGRVWQHSEAEHALGIVLSSFSLARHHRAYDGVAEQPNISVLPAPNVGKEYGLENFAAVIEASRTLTERWIADGGLEDTSGETATRMRRWSRKGR